MKWFWGRSRGAETQDFAQAIRPELRAMKSPAPKKELLDRIVASRASGARVILPQANGVVPRSRRRFLIPAALVAAVLVLALPFRESRQPRPASDEGSGIASEWFAGSVAFAQGDVDRASAPPIQFTRADRVRPITLEYLKTSRDSTGKDVTRLTALVTVRAQQSDGVPAWLVVFRSEGVVDGRARLAIDSVVVARDNLRPLRRSILVTPYSRYDEIRVAQNFHGDSVTGRMHAKGADATPEGRPIARKLSADAAPYIADGMPPFLLGAVQLERGWSGRASLMGWAVRDYDVFYPIELRVESEEIVTVPAGKFDCWRLSFRFARHTVQFWVRKTDGVAVRSLERESSGGAREILLLGLRSGD